MKTEQHRSITPPTPKTLYCLVLHPKPTANRLQHQARQMNLRNARLRGAFHKDSFGRSVLSYIIEPWRYRDLEQQLGLRYVLRSVQKHRRLVIAVQTKASKTPWVFVSGRGMKGAAFLLQISGEEWWRVYCRS